MMYKYIISFMWSFIYPCRMTFPLLGKNGRVLIEFLVPVGLLVLSFHFSPLVSTVSLSMLSSIVPCSSSFCGCLSSISFNSVSFVFTNNMSLFSIVSSSNSVGDVKSITLLVVVGFCFGPIACIN